MYREGTVYIMYREGTVYIMYREGTAFLDLWIPYRIPFFNIFNF